MVFSLPTDQGCAMSESTPDADGIQDFEDYVTDKFGDQGGFTPGDSACTGTMIKTIDFQGTPVSIYSN